MEYKINYSIHNKYDKNIFITLTNVTSEFYIKSQNTGLGNMLFQIASGLSYAIHYKANLNIIGLDNYISNEELNIENHIIRKIYNIPNYELYNSIKNNIQVCHNNKEYIFNHTFYDNIHFNFYYENYNNFDKIKNIILDCFSPIDTDIEFIMKKYPILKDDDLCSIHIRMGPDIMNYRTPEEIKDIELGYKVCLDHMIQYKKIKKCFVFTNDKEYSQQLLSNYKNINFYYSDEKDFVDIWMISLIKNNIVSFSTLSWWGSYLNKCPEQYIVCFKNFRNDLHYPGWNIINP